jgi:hypothetical protein
MIRQEAIGALDKFASVVGADTVVTCMHPFLTQDSNELRTSVIAWIVANADGYRKSDTKSFVQPILACLTDKNKEIRTAAEQLLELTLPETTAEPFLFALKDLKPAFTQMVKPVLAKYGAYEEEAAAAAAASNSAKDSQSRPGTAAGAGNKGKPNETMPPRPGTSAAAAVKNGATSSENGKREQLHKSMTTVQLNKTTDAGSKTPPKKGAAAPAEA